MNATSIQQQAIAARGNVLLVAGAGTGKTHTLVQRCLDCLLHEQPPVAIGEILIVTFNDAAAAEVRERLRVGLEALPDARAREHVALFETAHIGTLHSFCFKLVREHFYELELDPQLAVLQEEEAALVAEEALDEVLKRHYSGKTDEAKAVRNLVEAHGGRRGDNIRALIKQIHKFSQTLPNPQSWFGTQLEQLAKQEPEDWRAWLEEGFDEWRESWTLALTGPAVTNPVAASCLKAMKGPRDWASAGTLFDALNDAFENYPKGGKGKYVDPLKKLQEDIEFLSSLVVEKGNPDPLQQDWDWVRGQMNTLLKLVLEYAAKFAESKRELGALDFHDLEQFALRLLWDHAANAPTEIAREWRGRLRFVFVDEYQDINAAQDCIVTALGGEGPAANRFLVGDIKQSIYRFRLANPAIFRDYIKHWAAGQGTVLPLVDNFRSREALLDFVNSFFAQVMREDLGGVPYDDSAVLRFGAPADRAQLSRSLKPEPVVDVHLRLKSKSEDRDDAEQEEDLAGMEDAEIEARLVALRLRDLKEKAVPVWDKDLKDFRPMEWGDMAILLRARTRKAEAYAREFGRLNLPLRVERGGFYESQEVNDLLSLLNLMDNPLQDLPQLCVLRSPLAGLSTEELGWIRLATKGHFWTALTDFHTDEKSRSRHPETWDKVSRFMTRFAKWRRLARQSSLSRCLDAVLTETCYAEWLLTQPQAAQSEANVRRLLALARRFDQFQRQGLYRFLCFIDAQKRLEAEPALKVTHEQDSVRLLSIHQSKGLEFPVVVVPDLAKKFNTRDLNADIILQEHYGLCPRIKPPQVDCRYPSAPHWLASRREHHELIGEELRLLYVAMTRARDRLLLVATLPRSTFEDGWQPPGRSLDLSLPRSCADWLGAWFAVNVRVTPNSPTSGQTELLRWNVHEDGALALPGPDSVPSRETVPDLGQECWDDLKGRLTWRYGHQAATVEPAKTSVSLLRRRAREEDEEAATLTLPRENPAVRAIRAVNARKAAETGTATHRFLQFVDLARTGSLAELKSEAERIASEGQLEQSEVRQLDWQAMVAFWTSPLGSRVRQSKQVRRELPFTARFTCAETGGWFGLSVPGELAEEIVVVQGVADLVVSEPDALWIVDFKTDHFAEEQLQERAAIYEPQLRIYAEALGRIHKKPVREAWLAFLSLKRNHPLPFAKAAPPSTGDPSPPPVPGPSKRRSPKHDASQLMLGLD